MPDEVAAIIAQEFPPIIPTKSDLAEAQIKQRMIAGEISVAEAFALMTEVNA
ncbi:MAG TPA: hypothetical protein PKH39_19575 [Woeseiaceae bacterium]|nr:hypothetical protein [Woeseiaceae bacterium]